MIDCRSARVFKLIGLAKKVGWIGVSGLFVASTQVIAQERELFFWDAESDTYIVEGEVSGCTELKGGSVLDSNEKRNGNRSIRHTFGDDQRDVGCNAAKTPSGGDVFDGSTLVFRAWIKFERGFDWGTYHKKAKFAHLKRSNEQSPVYGVIYIRDNGFEFTGKMIDGGSIPLSVDLDQSDGRCNESKFATLSKSCFEWRHYTVQIRQNTCPSCKDGVFEVYVDGKLADRKSGVTFAQEVPEDGVTSYTFAWAGLGGKAFPQMCANGSTCSGIGGNLWIDDISVALVDGPGSSVSAPASPEPLVRDE